MRRVLADHIRDPGMSDGAGRRRTGAPGVVPGLGDREDAAGELRRQANPDDHLDGREPPFGLLFDLQQLRGFVVEGQIGLQLADASARCRELGTLD
jgi:hypothetical protein